MERPNQAWLQKMSAWATLVRMRANYEDHALHESTYKPLFKWLCDNQPDKLGFPPQEDRDE